MLDEALEGRDLRITSQTGSGKTIAIGFAVRDLLDDLTMQFGGVARPRVLIRAPTRELAKQLAEELKWLFAHHSVRVAAVTGGSVYLDQKRALSSNPAVVVATPGRLRDALERGKIDSTALAAVVLDEADSMLDLGFREDLDAILALLPKERRSHLVSATFSRDVVELADRFQREPVHVEGTRLGEAHADIEHVIHLVEPSQRVDALINLLLSDEDAKSLVFARTRADVARIAGELTEAGFVVRTLSGEMEQPGAGRRRALEAFRKGGVQALVATDVAARGIDVRDIARVIQVEPPTDVETYTHQSGRTGRAEQAGTSVLFQRRTVAPLPPSLPAGSRAPRSRTGSSQFRGPRRSSAPAKRSSSRGSRARGTARPSTRTPHLSLAERIVQGGSLVSSVARLIEKAGLHGPTKAREVRPILPPSEHRREPPLRTTRAKPPAGGAEWVTFRVSWGGKHGADARRLLAVACRRGQIRGSDVGAIRVEATFSLIDVARGVAEAFEVEAARPDPRNPRMQITRSTETASHAPAAATDRLRAALPTPVPPPPPRPDHPPPPRPSRGGGAPLRHVSRPRPR